MATIDKINQLTRLLLPRGRAFKMPFGGFFEKLMVGLAQSEARAYDDAAAILFAIIPDNPGFTLDDCEDWEVRLGLISNSAVSLSDRMLAIRRKMAYPGDIKARQHYLYIQGQLQASGFNVYVYENIWQSGYDLVTRTVFDVFNLTNIQLELGDAQFGDSQFGGGFHFFIANYIDPVLDAGFNVGSTLRFTFFIGGPIAGGFVPQANIPAARLSEFRELVLKLKPRRTTAYYNLTLT